MDDVKWNPSAGLKANADFICINSYSGYRSTAIDLTGKQYVFVLDASDEDLGRAVLDALANSRFLTLEEAEVFFDYRLVAQRYEEWVKSLMDRFAYKTRRAMFKDMKSCAIECEDGRIVIRPSNHQKLEGWGGHGIAPEDHVSIPADSPPQEIGAALRLALSRCI